MTSREQLDDTPPSLEHPRKYPNRNIKERLNMHVKRRLQEHPAGGEQSRNNSAFGAALIACTTSQKRGAPSERGTVSHGGGRGGKKSRNTKHLTLNVSSASSTCPDDECCSRDGSLMSFGDLNRDKVQSPDILTTVLNYKKLSLLQDSTVMNSIDDIRAILRSKTEDGDGG